MVYCQISLEGKWKQQTNNSKYIVVNLLANWNIDKLNNVFKILDLNFKKVNGDQSSVLTLKAVIHYINNWFPKHEANAAK